MEGMKLLLEIPTDLQVPRSPVITPSRKARPHAPTQWHSLTTYHLLHQTGTLHSMSDPMVAKLQDWLRAHEQELLDDPLAMLRIPSIETDAESNAPYGKANRDALDLALNLAGKYGMRTNELEGHIGWGEIGSGDRLVMSLGPLDVGSVGPGWEHETVRGGVGQGQIFRPG